MKIPLSRHTRILTAVFLAVLLAVAVLTALTLTVYEGESTQSILLCLGGLALMIGYYFYAENTKLLSVEIAEGELRSYSLTNKLLCTVKLDEPVWYALLDEPEGRRERQYIAVSNEEFKVKASYGMTKLHFIQSYDTAKRIVLPYDESTKPLLDTADWTKVN